jgi:hypothetical protein
MAEITTYDTTGIFGGYGLNSGHLTADERPNAYNTAVAKIGLAGQAPITAMLNMMGSSKVTDPTFKWWEQKHALQNGDADFYEDSALSDNSWGSDPAAGTTLYAKVAEAVAKHFRAGHEVRIIDKDGSAALTVTAAVAGVTLAGASSKLELVLNSATTAAFLNAADFVQGNGNAHAQGSMRPDIVGYAKEQKYNHTQIFRNPYKLTATSAATNLRTGDKLKDLRAEHLHYHGTDMESAFLWGERDEDLSGDEPKTKTRGIVEWIKNDAAANFVHFGTDYSGTWNAEGIDFIESNMTQLFTYGNGMRTKMGFCGGKFMELMNRAARLNGTIQISTGHTDFGLEVTRWVAPQGTVYWKQHPLFSRNQQDQYSCLFVEPSLMKRRVLRETDNRILNSTQKKEVGFEGYDGIVEEYITEVGLELHNPEAFGFWQIGET